MHPCSDFSGEGPSPLDLPIPAALKQQWLDLATRRQFLGRSGKVLGWAGLAKLMSGNAMASGGDPGVLLPHFAPKAKRAIYLFMAGAPSQFETWDYKPDLIKRFDQDLPESVRGGQVLTGMTASQSRFPIAPSVFNFAQHGQALYVVDYGVVLVNENGQYAQRGTGVIWRITRTAPPGSPQK